MGDVAPTPLARRGTNQHSCPLGKTCQSYLLIKTVSDCVQSFPLRFAGENYEPSTH